MSGTVVPVFRMFDVDKAKEFYCDFLGGEVVWEHTFEPDLPVYMQVDLQGISLHLSEHFGDATPGSTVRIACDDLDTFQKQLLGKKYKNARPGIEEQEWGMREMRVSDPFGNRLIFAAPIPKSTK